MGVYSGEETQPSLHLFREGPLCFPRSPRERFLSHTPFLVTSRNGPSRHLPHDGSPLRERKKQNSSNSSEKKDSLAGGVHHRTHCGSCTQNPHTFVICDEFFHKSFNYWALTCDCIPVKSPPWNGYYVMTI